MVGKKSGGGGAQCAVGILVDEDGSEDLPGVVGRREDIKGSVQKVCGRAQVVVERGDRQKPPYNERAAPRACAGKAPHHVSRPLTKGHHHSAWGGRNDAPTLPHWLGWAGARR